MSKTALTIDASRVIEPLDSSEAEIVPSSVTKMKDAGARDQKRRRRAQYKIAEERPLRATERLVTESVASKATWR